MVQQTEIPQSQKKELQTQSQINEDEEIDEVQIPPHRTIYDKVREVAERFASTRIGQFVVERTDRALKTIEDTAKWSLPQDKGEERLQRPLPWIPFLAMIVALRLIRIWLSIAALLIGNGPISAQDAIYFIQTRRRKLRSIRVQGLKTIRQREAEESLVRSGSGDDSLVTKLRRLMSTAICRPGQFREPGRRIFIHQGKEREPEEATTERRNSKRQRDEDCSVQNLTIDEMLSKFANEDSEDDSDFIPNPEDENHDDSTSSGTSSTSSTDEDLKNEVSSLKDANHKNESTFEIKENGGSRVFPKPMLEIKTEPISDIESGNEPSNTQTPKENGPQNGGDVANHKNSTPTTTHNSKLKLPNRLEENSKKSISGQESAAMMKAKKMPALRSPTDFNAYFDTIGTRNNSTPDLNDVSGSNKSSNKDEKTLNAVEPIENSSYYANYYQQRQNQNQNQQNPHQYRYRGKNRR